MQASESCTSLQFILLTVDPLFLLSFKCNSRAYQQFSKYRYCHVYGSSISKQCLIVCILMCIVQILYIDEWWYCITFVLVIPCLFKQYKKYHRFENIRWYRSRPSVMWSSNHWIFFVLRWNRQRVTHLSFGRPETPHSIVHTLWGWRTTCMVIRAVIQVFVSLRGLQVSNMKMYRGLSSN